MTEPHVTRRSLVSGCSSAPSVLASRVRTSSSSILRSVAARRGPTAASPPPGGTAARRRPCRRRTSGRRPRLDPRRAARSTARAPGPDPSPRRPGSPVTVADDRSPRASDRSAVTRTRSRSIRPWVMPASWSRLDLSARDPRPRPRRSRSAGRCGLERRRDRRAERAHDHQRVAPPGTPRGDEMGHVGAGALGEQGDEGFVLDELHPAEADGPLGSPVPDEAPQVGQQLGVPRIAAVHLDDQRPLVVGALEQHDSLRLHRRRREIVDANSEVGEGEPDPRRGRAPARRTDGEVDGRRGEEPQRDGRRRARRQRGPEHDRRRRTGTGSASDRGCGTAGPGAARPSRSSPWR